MFVNINLPLSLANRRSRQKISENTKDLKKISRLDLMDIYRTMHLAATKQNSFQVHMDYESILYARQ